MGQNFFNGSRFFRNDAEISGYVNQQLQAIVPEYIEEVYGAFEYADHIPVISNVNAAAATVAFDTYTHVGMAEIFRGSGEDLPLADAARDRTQIPVFDIGIKTETTDLEAEQAKMAELADRAAGMNTPYNLEKEKERAAGLAVAFRHNELALGGDASTGILGLVNQPNIGSYPAPNGAGGSALWENKTADEIVADLTGLLSFVTGTTKVKAYYPNRLLLSENKYNIAAQKRLPNSDMSVLKWFEQNNILGSQLKVTAWNQLNGKGTGGTGIAFCYRMDPSVLAYRPVVNYRVGQPKRLLLGTQVPHTGRSAGVTVTRPFAVGRMQGF